ncbi:MAG: PDZ domain-containing protein [Oscillospiraceae bacterium]|nr:PDZ domain-containing protein [Oscillospiraceae bacterium]
MYEKNWSEQEQTCYRTGFTQPKKQKRGPVSVLLVLVIFFGGINTAFRLLNIRLFREITSDAALAPASVQFSGKTRAASGAPGLPALGLTGKEISAFEQQCYEIPKGFYITAVEPGSCAEKAGIQPGDILLYFNNTRASSLNTLKEILYSHTSGDTVKLRLHRSGAEYSVAFRLD